MSTDIIFIQLPLVDHGWNYIDGNVQYAPAAISAFIKKNINPHLATETLPQNISNFSSNSIIEKYVTALKPKIISFTAYLWNIERSLEIAQKLKNDDTIIIFGGPEISEGSTAFECKREYVDYFVQGEGEWFFDRYYNGETGRYLKTINGNTVITQPSTELLKTEDIQEPFSSNMMNVQNDGSIFLEITRGCPYKCSYCYYSKNAAKVRTHDIELITNALANKNRKLSEIYILSPTFDKSPNYVSDLKRLKDANTEHVALHTEMRTDGVDAQKAAMIRDAGFRSLEVGLQSMTNKALESIARKSDINREIAGMKHLKNAGIDLKIGIIPGLPGDTPQEFKKTVDRLSFEGFDDNIEFYPLMILPGTRIRNDADREGYAYQKKPPYFIISTNDFSYNDIIDIKEYIEEKTGFINEVKRLPDFLEYDNSVFIKGLTVADPGNFNAQSAGNCVDTSVFSLVFENIDTGKLKNVLAEIEVLVRQGSADQLYNIIFNSASAIDENLIYEFIERIRDDSFFNRMHLYDHWSFSSRVVFYQLSDDPDFIARANTNYSIIEPILTVTEHNREKVRFCEDTIINLLINTGMYKKMKKSLMQHYSEFYDKIAFVSPDEMKEFFTDTNQKFNDYHFRAAFRRI
jgi:hypothetical protein